MSAAVVSCAVPRSLSVAAPASTAQHPAQDPAGRDVRDAPAAAQFAVSHQRQLRQPEQHGHERPPNVERRQLGVDAVAAAATPRRRRAADRRRARLAGAGPRRRRPRRAGRRRRRGRGHGAAASVRHPVDPVLLAAARSRRCRRRRRPASPDARLRQLQPGADAARRQRQRRRSAQGRPGAGLTRPATSRRCVVTGHGADVATLPIRRHRTLAVVAEVT